jgi:SPP1 gp7 family putative phage head morphogenesis protein
MPDRSPQQLPFKQAIEYYRQKVAIPSEQWDEIVDAANDWAFAVAGVTRADVLADLQAAVDKAISAGTSMAEFRRDFDQIVQKRGWGAGKSFTPYRVELILSQNLRTAYQAGRYQQMSTPEMTKARPYWQCKHRDSRHPRPAHLALDGRVFSFDDPFWQGGFFPSGWGCRCTVHALSERDMVREGLKVEDSPTDRITLRDRITGKTQSVPAINGQPVIEPGFNFTPGASRAEERSAILERMLERLPENLRRKAEASIGDTNQS